MPLVLAQSKVKNEFSVLYIYTKTVFHVVHWAIQAIHDQYEVCENWGMDHYSALQFPKADFDCETLNPVDDNSEEFEHRMDVVGACTACVQSDCLNVDGIILIFFLWSIIFQIYFLWTLPHILIVLKIFEKNRD